MTERVLVFPGPLQPGGAWAQAALSLFYLVQRINTSHQTFGSFVANRQNREPRVQQSTHMERARN